MSYFIVLKIVLVAVHMFCDVRIVCS